MIGDYLEPFTRLRRTDMADGEAGHSSFWAESEPFQAGVTQPLPEDHPKNGGPGAKTEPTLYCETRVDLRSGDLVRRASDGALFQLIGELTALPCPLRPKMYRGRVERVVRG